MKIILILFLTSILFVFCSDEDLEKQYGKPINKEYSRKLFSYHGLTFKNIPAEKFNNSIIIGSCFYQEYLEGEHEIVKDIFPDFMEGVIFISCNLDNVYVNEDNNTILKETTSSCSNKIIQVQNDWDDWILDENLNPLEPINKEDRLRAQKSISPFDIPSVKWTKEERSQFEKDLYSYNTSINP